MLSFLTTGQWRTWRACWREWAMLFEQGLVGTGMCYATEAVLDKMHLHGDAYARLMRALQPGSLYPARSFGGSFYDPPEGHDERALCAAFFATMSADDVVDLLNALHATNTTEESCRKD